MRSQLATAPPRNQPAARNNPATAFAKWLPCHDRRSRHPTPTNEPNSLNSGHQRHPHHPCNNGRAQAEKQKGNGNTRGHNETHRQDNQGKATTWRVRDHAPHVQAAKRRDLYVAPFASDRAAGAGNLAPHCMHTFSLGIRAPNKKTKFEWPRRIPATRRRGAIKHNMRAQ